MSNVRYLSSLKSKMLKVTGTFPKVISVLERLGAVGNTVKTISGLSALTLVGVTVFPDATVEALPQQQLHTALAQIARDANYEALLPANELHGPGVYTTFERTNSGELSLHQTCRMNLAQLATLWTRSDTPLVSNSAVANGPEWLHEVRVVTLSDEDLAQIQNQYVRGTCEQVILTNLENEARVCQVREVLQGVIVPSAQSADFAPVRAFKQWYFTKQLFFGVKFDESRCFLPTSASA